MKGPFRNHFLLLCSLALAAFLLSACGARHVTRPDEPSSPTAAVHKQPLLPIMGYTIQVGAFSKVENAARLTARLTKQGLPAYYYRGEKGLYRVRFGNFATPGQATETAQRLQKEAVYDVYAVVQPASYPVLRYRDQEELIRGQLVSVSQQFVGVPYQWGDARPGEGFDCSGLTMMVYQLIGLDMPRSSRDQFRRGRSVDREELRPGDLLFFSTDQSGHVSHVGIYQGEGQFVHAPGTGRTVSRANLSSDYFSKRYLGARTYL